MQRPRLERLGFRAAVGAALNAGVPIITMSRNQWDTTLHAAYLNGWLLVELDANERPVGAYRRPLVEAAQG